MADDFFFYAANDLIGGAAGALDAIDGSGLADKDGAVVITPTIFSPYHLDADSGAAEASPRIIAPDDNPGDKRWLLRSGVFEDVIAYGNVGIGQTTFGTNAAKVFAQANGTAPTTSPADCYQVWSADRGGTGGKAGMHIRTEDGTQHVFADLVGLGTLLPEAPCHVFVSDASIAPDANAQLVIEKNGHTAVQLLSGATSVGQLLFGNSDNTFQGGLRYWHDTHKLDFSTNRGVAGDVVRLIIDASGNVIIGNTLSVGDNAVGILSMNNGIAPTTFPANCFQMYSFDVVGGNAAPHIYTENGALIILYRVIDARIDDAINSGDATTDGVIDAMRDAMIAHGLIAAA